MRTILSVAIFGIGFGVSLISPITVAAQTLVQEEQDFVLAEVREVLNERTEVEGFDVETHVQTLSMEILDGAAAGTFVNVYNDYTPLSIKERAYLVRTLHIGGEEYYYVFEKDRRGVLVGVAALFVLAVILLGGWQGARALLSLLGGLLVIVYVLAPSLMAGYPPVLVSSVVASVILFMAIFFTHGFNRNSLIAFLGTMGAVAATGILASAVVSLARFSGLSSDDAVFLNFVTGGQLDIAGLLLASIIIGIIGVLDDIAITQVAVVRELRRTDAALPALSVYKRALSVGREHAGALVNTLVLAYTSAALPLVLLFAGSGSGFMFILNREIVALEVVRALVGSIGLMLTVPLTTVLAVYFSKGGADGIEAKSHIHIH